MIREARRNDLYGLLKLYTQLHKNPMPDDYTAAQRVWEQIFADDNHHIIVAEENGMLIASCVMVVIPNLTNNQRPYALIENVITDAAFRRRGYASACLDFARDIAEAAGCYKLMLMTGSKSEGTLRFYERAGYNRKDKTAFIQWLNK